MKDRIPTYPGRVKLTPVAGQENVYDLVRMDEPTEVGTPLDKANLLADATAALIGLTDETATVNHALAATWEKAEDAMTQASRFVTGSYLGTGAAAGVSITFAAPPKYVWIVDVTGGVTAPLAIVTEGGGMKFDSTANNGNAPLSNCTISGNVLSWTGSGSSNLNGSGVTYYYAAILGSAE